MSRRAPSHGIKTPRGPALRPAQVECVKQMLLAGTFSYAQISEAANVSESSIGRIRLRMMGKYVADSSTLSRQETDAAIEETNKQLQAWAIDSPTVVSRGTNMRYCDPVHA